MARVRWLAFLSVLVPSLLCANEPHSPLHSTFQIKQHLFAQNLSAGMSGSSDLLADDERRGGQKKSVGLAAIYSLLLPGMGELYAGNFSSGKYFLIGEGALWLTYTVFEVYGNSIRDDARAFAASRAGVNLSGKDDQFFIDIGQYFSDSTYNEAQLRNRAPDKLYDPAAGYGWRWESETDRLSYQDQRISSDNMYNNRRFVVGAILINHVASAINAARAAVLHNKDLESQSGDLRFKAGVLGGLMHPHGIVITVSKGL